MSLSTDAIFLVASIFSTHKLTNWTSTLGPEELSRGCSTDDAVANKLQTEWTTLTMTTKLERELHTSFFLKNLRELPEPYASQDVHRVVLVRRLAVCVDCLLVWLYIDCMVDAFATTGVLLRAWTRGARRARTT